MRITLTTVIISMALLCVANSKEYIRGCYYTNWAQYRPGKGKYMPENYVPGLCTHIFYAFAVMTQDFNIKPFEWNDESTEWSKGMYERVNDLKKQQTGLKVLLSFGGWKFSQENLQLMSTLLASADNRHHFVDSSLAFVRKHNFDGFDIDIEYPRAQDKANFVAFVSEMKAAFEEESRRTGKERLLLTAAVAAGFEKIEEGYDVPSLAKLFDFINIMTYDFHGAWEQLTGMNSPLYDTNGDKYAMSNAANIWTEKGAPKDKLMIGFAAYGRGWTLRNISQFQIGSPASEAAQALPYTRANGVGSYYEMCDLLESGARRYQDDRTKAPYLVKDYQWFGYDDEWSFKIKLNWLKENGFGGAFTWALDMDDFTGQCKSSAGQKFPLHKLITDALGENKVTFLIPNSTGTIDNHFITTPAPYTRSQSTSTLTDNGNENPDKPFKCPAAGTYPDPDNCQNFYLCSSAGTAYLQTCPAALLFNPAISACDWAENVQCGKV